MSVVVVLRAMAHLLTFSALVLLGTGTIVAGVNAANAKTPALCAHPACTVVSPLDQTGLTSADHVKAVAAHLWKSKA